MIKLSVNVNKVATVRNSRGGTVPSVLEAVEVCVEAGAPGITVHPRADARHITRPTSTRSPTILRPFEGRVEFNIEGDPRPDLLALVHEVRPDQCTLVPVTPGEITSQAGWSTDTPARRAWRAVVRGSRDPRGPRQPVRRSRAGRHPLGRRDGRRPRRALHRAVRAGVRGGRRRATRPRAVRGAAGLRIRSRARRQRRPRSRSRQSPCSAGCRTSTKCRSAMRSSATRCSSASIASCAST